MHEIIREIEKEYLRDDLPEVRIGDTVKLYVKVVEDQKERVQPFEGIVIRKRGGGTRETFTVRKLSQGIAIERIFPLHSPRIVKIEVLKRAKVRRAKLYYLRDKIGKKAKLKELR